MNNKHTRAKHTDTKAETEVDEDKTKGTYPDKDKHNEKEPDNKHIVG